MINRHQTYKVPFKYIKMKKNNLKILLIVPRYSFSTEVQYTYSFPLGIGYILAALRKAKFDVSCLNINHCNGLTNKIVKAELDKKNYDIVATGSFGYSYLMVEDLFKAIREHPSNPKIILGGAIITSAPEVILNALKPDFGVIGEGEETILKLLNCVEKKGDFKKIEGIIYKDYNQNIIITSPRKPIKNLDNLPFPDLEEFGFEKKLNHQYSNSDPFTRIFDYPRAYPIIASRGCVFDCTFCFHTQGHQYRERSIENVIKEIKFVVEKYKINFIHIYDDLFSLKKEKIYKFCKEIKKLSEEVGYDIKWFCQLTVYSAERELLKTMKDAGCVAISYGFESYNKEVLKSMRKPITPQGIDAAIKLTMEAGLTIQGNFIFGDAVETKETAQTTINYWKKNCKGQVFLSFIQPYPGSAINKHCLEKGLIKDQLTFIKNMPNEDILNMTNMNDEEFSKLKKTIKKLMTRNTHAVKLIYIKRTGGKAYEIKTKCPFCHKKNIYKNHYLRSRYFYQTDFICKHCGMRGIFIGSLYNFIIKLNLILPLREIFHKLVKKETRFRLLGRKIA